MIPFRSSNQLPLNLPAERPSNSPRRETPPEVWDRAGKQSVSQVREDRKPVGRPDRRPTQVVLPGRLAPNRVKPIPLYQRGEIGPVLEKVMELSGTHQSEVARRMRVRPQSVNQYVKKRRSRPSLDWLLHFLNVNGAALCIVFPKNFHFNSVLEALDEDQEESGIQTREEARGALGEAIDTLGETLEEIRESKKTQGDEGRDKDSDEEPDYELETK